MNKRQCYSIKCKLEVISYAKTHGNTAAERHFGPTEKLVQDWRRQELTLDSVVGKRKKTLPSSWHCQVTRIRSFKGLGG